MRNRRPIFVLRPREFNRAVVGIFHLLYTPAVKAEESGTRLLSGPAAMGDWTSDAPGVRRRITVNDLPPPSSNVLAINRARVVERPAGAQPQVPTGFKIELYAEGFRDPDICSPRRTEIFSSQRVGPIKSRCCAIPKVAASPTSRNICRARSE